MRSLEGVKEAFQSGKVLYTRHARDEMLNEEFGLISDAEVEQAILSGIIIEDYPEDKPYHSLLILGRTHSGRPLHTVAAWSEEENICILVTVYEPDPDLWIEFKTRRTE